MLQAYDGDFYLEEDTMKLLDDRNETDTNDNKSSEKKDQNTSMKIPGKAVLIDNKVVEEKPFQTNDELPEAELYFGGERETDTEHHQRMIRISQQEEMARLGMTVSSGHVVIKKDNSNMIGVSIGGGGPYCPCLYVVQIFDNTPVSREGTLQSGDELLGINGASVKGKTKVEVAKMIQSQEHEVTIHYNKLHADNQQGETLDIALKKIKHRLVENMSAKTADALGLSRAILCNDSLVKRLQELEGTEVMYRGLVDYSKRVLKAYFNVFQAMNAFGTEFCQMSIREPQPTASEAYRAFGEMHRSLEKEGIKMIKALKPVIANFGTYLHKAIPDTKLTVRKYADSKFAYLSYCLKVKEMDDEEQSYNAIQEPLYRVETGNYEYRLVLRCRQEARAKFAKLRNDVLEKIELLEAKHAQNLADNLKMLLDGLLKFTQDAINKFETTKGLFPIEVSLKSDAFEYQSNKTFSADGQEEEEVAQAEEAKEAKPVTESKQDLLSNGSTNNVPSQDLLDLMMPGMNAEENKENGHPTEKIQQVPTSSNIDLLSKELTMPNNNSNSLLPDIQNLNITDSSKTAQDLLAELGLDEIDLSIGANNNAAKLNSIDDLLN
ncbi:PRKCA-binding protein isoform X1 [Chironomus tepperi]|uniref:PRKCA-binding protein isoform X1 n=1 Tax=Chironomus tepperi TaxID=113505 RepID=UPI00391F78C2